MSLNSHDTNFWYGGSAYWFVQRCGLYRPAAFWNKLHRTGVAEHNRCNYDCSVEFCGHVYMRQMDARFIRFWIHCPLSGVHEIMSRPSHILGSILDCVIGIFYWDPSGRTMAVRSTQTLTEMCTRNVSLRYTRPVRRADNLTTFMCWWALISWNSQGLSRAVQGLLYLYRSVSLLSDIVR
jgi:hypothetical protein